MTNLQDVMNQVRREDFISLAFLGEVKNSTEYKDTRIPIGFNQHATKPSEIKKALEVLLDSTNNRDSVLEIGTGCGYQTAILAKLFKKVYTIEYFELLSRRAAQAIKADNVSYIVGDAKKCIKGNFDAVISGTCFTDIPENIKGEVIVMPIGDSKSQYMYKITKDYKEKLYECGYVLAQD